MWTVHRSNLHRDFSDLAHQRLGLLASPFSTAEDLIDYGYAECDNPSSLLGLARSERVFNATRDALIRLGRIESTRLSPADIHVEYSTKIVARRNELACEQQFLSRACSQLRLAVSFLKGHGVEAFYPKGAIRDYSDIDILVRDNNTFWPLAVLLINTGYELNSAAFALSGDRLIGEVQLRKPFAPSVKVDCSIWGQPTSKTSWIEYPDDFWASQRYLTGPSPSPLYSIAILLGELTERRHLFMRDVFDALCITTHIPDGDLQKVANVLHSCRLISAFRAVAAAASQLKDVLATQPDRLFTILTMTESSDVMPESIYASLREAEHDSRDRNRSTLMPNVFYHFSPAPDRPAGDLNWSDAVSNGLMRTPIGCFKMEA